MSIYTVLGAKDTRVNKRDRQLPSSGKTDPGQVNLNVSSYDERNRILSRTFIGLRQTGMGSRRKEDFEWVLRYSVSTRQRGGESVGEKASTDTGWWVSDGSQAVQNPFMALLVVCFPHKIVKTSWGQGPNLTCLFISGIHHNIWYIGTERIKKRIQNVSKAYSLYVLSHQN